MILRTFLIVGSLLCVFTYGYSISHEDELRNELLKNYNPSALPQLTTEVRLRFTVLKFDMNEKLHSLDLDLWIAMDWQDPRLTWYTGSYPDVRKVAFRRDQVWHPDISVYNNAMVKEMDHFSDAQVLAKGDGSMNWVPPAHVKATCIMDMTYWPYDAHNCTVKFGSWVYDGSSVNLKLKDDVINFKYTEMSLVDDLGGNISHGQWKLIMSNLVREEAYYDCCPELYVSVSLVFLLQREAPAYSWMVQTPIIVMCLFTIVIFLLPPSSGEKILLGGIIMFVEFIYLIALSAYIGHSPDHTPLIVQLLAKQLILAAISIIASAIILRLIRDPHAGGFPAFLRVPLVTFSTCLFVGGYRQMVTTSLVPFSRTLKGEDVELNDGNCRSNTYVAPRTKGSECDWLLLAAVLDRICLIIFTVIFVINMIHYSDVL